MTDRELLIAGVVITFIAVAGAYLNVKRRANQDPVESYDQSRTRDEAS